MRETPESHRQPWYKRHVGYVVTGLTAAVFSVVLYSGAQYFVQTKTSPTEPPTVVEKILDNPAHAQTEEEKGLLKKSAQNFRLIAKKVGPDVVNIKSTKKPPEQQMRVPRRGGRPRGMPEGQEEMDPFFEFFEHFGRPFPFQQGPQQPQVGLGSGILIDKRGYIVTNNHVVEGAHEVVVSMDGEKKEHKAKIVGTDPKTDLAVLKVEDLSNLPAPAEWADSDAVEVGDWAVAIGSPFALGQTVTVGIVSAKGGRNAVALGGDYGGDLIQTDAAINPGNSGGPLCDIEGKVMGVNTAIYTRSGGYMGIGFAIPSNLAKEVVSTLIKDGKIIRGWLGVYIQPLKEGMAKDLGVQTGVSVHEVISGSPAAEAGLQAGDVITEIDDKPVKDVGALQQTIMGKKPGQSVKLKVMGYGNKKARTMSVKIGEVPAENAEGRGEGGGGKGSAMKPDHLGLTVGPTRKKEGVVVETIQPGSVAEGQGLEVGDIISSINRKKMASVSEYKKAVGSGKLLTLEVWRKGRKLFFQFEVP